MQEELGKGMAVCHVCVTEDPQVVSLLGESRGEPSHGVHEDDWG